MLTATDITKAYKNNRTVIDNLSYKFENNNLYAVMGESGSGKSTLLAILAGLLKPDSGAVDIDGKDLYKLNQDSYLRVRQKTIAYIPQSNVLLKQYSVLENILLPHILSENSALEKELTENALLYLDALGILNLKDSFPYEISGGEAKRVSIARAMVINPEIVIADEPTTGLDKNTGKIIFDFFARYANQGNSFVVATHDDLVKEYTDNILILERQKQA